MTYARIVLGGNPGFTWVGKGENFIKVVIIVEFYTFFSCLILSDAN